MCAFHVCLYLEKNIFICPVSELIFVYILGFHKVMEGIQKALELGYDPVKVRIIIFLMHVFGWYHCC